MGKLRTFPELCDCLEGRVDYGDSGLTKWVMHVKKACCPRLEIWRKSGAERLGNI